MHGVDDDFGLSFRCCFLVCSGLAAALLALPPCMRGKLGAQFLRRWPSVRALQSDDCRLDLLLLALRINLDCCDLECGHASARRRLKSRVQTHGYHFGEIAASTFLKDVRTATHDGVGKPRSVGHSARKKNKSGNVVQHGKYAGRPSSAGGRRCAASSELISKHCPRNPDGSKLKLNAVQKSELMSMCHRLANEAREEQNTRWEQIGADGVASFRAGAPNSFGTSRAKKAKVGAAAADAAPTTVNAAASSGSGAAASSSAFAPALAPAAPSSVHSVVTARTCTEPFMIIISSTKIGKIDFKVRPSRA